jgi:hypothetical protein
LGAYSIRSRSARGFRFGGLLSPGTMRVLCVSGRRRWSRANLPAGEFLTQAMMQQAAADRD